MSNNHHDDQSNAEQSLAQVRELLFGAQNRTLEHRCDQLESQMNHHYATLRDELGNQIQQLQNVLQEEINKLRGEVSIEKSDREKTIHAIQEVWGQQTNAIQDRMRKVHDEMRAYTLDQTQHLWDDLQARYDALSERFDHQLGELRESTAERASLSDMFREMAHRLEEHSAAEKA